MADRVFSVVYAITQTIFWGVGYFFGFSIISMLSAGGLVPEQFTNIGRDRKTGFWKVIFVRDGKCFVLAELVATIGWLFLCLLLWGLFWFFG